MLVFPTKLAQLAHGPRRRTEKDSTNRFFPLQPTCSSCSSCALLPTFEWDYLRITKRVKTCMFTTFIDEMQRGERGEGVRVDITFWTNAILHATEIQLSFAVGQVTRLFQRKTCSLICTIPASQLQSIGLTNLDQTTLLWSKFKTICFLQPPIPDDQFCVCAITQTLQQPYHRSPSCTTNARRNHVRIRINNVLILLLVVAYVICVSRLCAQNNRSHHVLCAASCNNSSATTSFCLCPAVFYLHRKV